MEQSYTVLTGIRRFEVSASSFEQAVDVLKEKIRARAKVRKDPDIGMSLVEALEQGTLNFLVLDEAGLPVCGEYQGVAQKPACADLILSFPKMLSLRVLQSAHRQLLENTVPCAANKQNPGQHPGSVWNDDH